MVRFDTVAKFIAQYICRSSVCVETGTAYCFPEGDYTWNTTSAIAKIICEPANGHLFSIDLLDRSDNINTIFRLGNIDHTTTTLLNGHSVEVLQNLSVPHIDLLCLDSGEDEDLLVKEYEAVKNRLAEKHYVLVDDIHNPNSVKYKKIVPLLKQLGYDWIEVATDTGLFFSSKGYPIPQEIK